MTAIENAYQIVEKKHKAISDLMENQTISSYERGKREGYRQALAAIRRAGNNAESNQLIIW